MGFFAEKVQYIIGTRSVWLSDACRKTDEGVPLGHCKNLRVNQNLLANNCVLVALLRPFRCNLKKRLAK